MKQVNTEEFNKIICGDKPVVCDFFATWCGPCKMLAPVMDKADEIYGDKAEFIKMDVDENMEIAQKLGIMSIPAIKIFRGGEEISSRIGFMTQSEMNAFIEENI